MIPEYATASVPYLGRLHVVPGLLSRKRKGKQSGDDRSYAAAWHWYLRGHIVSEHQRRIITAFLAINSATSSTDIGEDFKDDLPKGVPESYDTSRAASSLHSLVKRMSEQSGETKRSAAGQEQEEESRSLRTALNLGEQLWGLQEDGWQLGPTPLLGVVQATGESNEEGVAQRQKPGSSGPPAAIRLHPYMGYKPARRRAWFQALKASEAPPNAEQLQFLEAMADRFHCEAAEATSVVKGEAGSDPINVAVLAPPGTGKTYCILQLIKFMEDVLQWTAGVEFQTVASQNRMGMRVGGTTMHHWGEVPIDIQKPGMSEKKRSKTTGATDMYTKCEVLRVLLIDEISTASLQVLGCMESNMRRARSGLAWSTDSNGEPRDWGGVNLGIFGDWLQLPAVAAKSIFRNPFLKDYTETEKYILGMFWGLSEYQHPYQSKLPFRAH